MVVVVALCVSFYVSLGFKDRSELPSALIDHPIPPFELPQLNAEELASNADLPSNQAYLVNVWATWCAPCLFEHPVLMNIASAGIPIVGVSYKDDDEKALKWLADKGNPFSLNLMDRQGSLAIDLGMSGVPVTFLVDAQGVIRLKHMGELTQEEWEAEIKPVFDSFKDATV